MRKQDAKKNEDQAKIDALAARQVELEKVEPYMLLGIAPGADHETLRKAYIAKARAYHPDRFTDSELPPEVLDYLNAMARRINSAYEHLGDALEAAKKAR